MLDDLRDATIRERLRAIWEDPKSLDPTAHAAVPWTIIQTNIVGVFRLTAGLLPTRFFTPGCSRSGSTSRHVRGNPRVGPALGAEGTCPT